MDFLLRNLINGITAMLLEQAVIITCFYKRASGCPDRLTEYASSFDNIFP